MRQATGGRGVQPLRAQAQCPGGSAGQCLPSEFQQDPGATGSAAGGGDQPWGDRNNPPALERSFRAADESGHRLCPSAACGLRR